MPGKIMRSFKMTEISAVDRPAQVHARMSIMKRDDGNPAVTDGDIQMTEAEMIEITKKSKADMASLQAQLDDAMKEVADLKAQMGKRDETIVELTKANDIAKSDEVIKVGDTEIRKSAVGDSTFAMFKAQNAEIAKANDARELVELTKRAETELSALPGEAVAKAAVLKAVAKMAEAERTALDAMLKGGQAALASLMKSKGRDGVSGEGATADEKIEALAKSYAKEKGVTIAKATDAIMQTDEGRALYNDSRKGVAA
jgi:hypothetical protein